MTKDSRYHLRDSRKEASPFTSRADGNTFNFAEKRLSVQMVVTPIPIGLLIVAAQLFI